MSTNKPHANKNITWQKTDMIPVFHEMLETMLDSTQEQLKNLQQAKDKPHILDDHTVQRLLKLYTEQLEMLPLYQEQCQRWHTEKLNRQQKQGVTEIEGNIITLEKQNTEIIQLASSIEKNTIDKVLQKSDAEVGLDFLLGKHGKQKGTK